MSFVPPARRTLLSLTLVGGALLVAPPGVAHADSAPSSTPPGGSWVRAADLVAGSATLSVTLTPTQGAPLVLSGGLRNGQATSYTSLAPGGYGVTVTSASAAPGSAPLLSSTYTAVAGGAITLAAVGSDEAPRLAVIQDDLTPPSAGAARVRVLPAATADATVTVSAVAGPIIARNAVFGQPTPYASVPAGPWQLQLRTSTGGSATEAADLASGAIYTVLVVSSSTGGLQSTVLQDAAGVSVAPVGGVATGGGGTAAEVVGTTPAARTAGLGALAGCVLLGGVLVRRRRLPSR